MVRNSKIYIFSILLMHSVSIEAQSYMGEWANKNQLDRYTDNTPIRFYSEEKPYVKGGVRFIFPIGYFTASPHIYVSAQLKNVTYDASLEINVLITHLSPLFVEIYINKANTGLFQNYTTQAATNDVIVHILAYGY